jgi:outer membrane protein TolC
MRDAIRTLALAAVVGVVAAPAAAATHRLTLADAVRRAQGHSPTARRATLEARRDLLRANATRRTAWPDLALELTAPSWAQDFEVGLLPSAPGDSSNTPREVYVKATTTRRNAAGDLRLRQMLPWRGHVSALGSVFYRDESTSPIGIRAGRNDYQVQASVGIDVPVLGDDPERRALSRAALELQRARARERAARAELEFDTTSRYLALLRARSLLEIARAASEQAVRSHEVAQRKAAAGLLADVDRLQTDVYRADRDARVASADVEMARAHDELKIFLGIPVRDTLDLVELPRPFAAPDAAEPWIERALRERSDVGLVVREVELLVRERAARRPYLPEVDLRARYGGGASEALLDRALEALSANTLSFAVSLRMPLWDSGRRRLDDGADLATIELRRLDAADARARIELEVRDAVRQMQDAARRHSVLEASTRLAAELLRINGERFERGLIDAQAYLTAQIDAAAARAGAEAALLDLYQARARLRFVTLSEE